MSHTPGPWETSGVRISGYALAKERLLQINAGNGGVAWVIYSDLRHGYHQQSHADQRLIAAAPELLEALKKTVPLLQAAQRTRLLDEAIAVIAKATGGTQ